MTLLNITPEQARADAQQYREKLNRTLSALTGVRSSSPGCTPRDVVYTEDKVTLYRYRSPSAPSPLVGDDCMDAGGRVTPGAGTEGEGLSRLSNSGPAVLICYALINRPSMMDLQEDRSLIRSLLAKGIDVFLIDWGSPDGSDRYLAMHDYVNRYLHHCVAQVLRIRGETQVNLVGVCQGGTLSLCYTAQHPDKVKNLITMVTPVDFHTPNDLISKWVRHVDVDKLVDNFGNVSGETLNAVFLSLLPFRLMSQKYVGLLEIAQDPAQLENFLRMEQWIFDSPDNPGEMFRQFSTWFYKENRLKLGTLTVSGKPVDLKQVTMPVLNIYATQDHIVPPPASTCLQGLIGSRDYTTHAVPSGHIGIYVSSKTKELPTTIADWLKVRAI
jgi:polyhydroxyalkanoate synthase subunit PhaC